MRPFPFPVSDETVTAAHLLREVAPVPPEMNVTEVFQRFESDKNLFALPVVSDGHPVGIVNRRKIIERFARPYTRELFGRKSVTEFMEASPFIVDIHMGLDDLSQTVLEFSTQFMYDGFIITSNGRYAGMGTGIDLLRTITEHNQAHLYQLAHYDALTGLPNRLLLTDRLTQARAHAHRAERLVGVLLLDVDRFKAINDTLGHSMGDLLLREVAERLSGCVREGDTVARLGGDEFTVLLPELRYIEDCATVARKILESLTRPFPLDGHEVFVSASIGITLYPFDESIDTLLRNADTAMYHVKENGGNGFEYYTTEMSTASLKRLSLESALRRALERQEFVLHYQPQVDLVSGHVVGAEALLRWQHPEWGLVAPGDFIPLAEETGLIVPIGKWVLFTACRQAKDWQDAGHPPITVAINVSARQFYQKDFMDTVCEVLETTQLDPRYLEIELTEGTVMQNGQATTAMLNELHKMGIQFSIDDFGTGYSSLSYLKRFPIDRIKIDRSFVTNITSDTDDAALASAIIAMSHALDIQTVAEGVETKEQLAFLRDRRCDQIQGYLFSRPIPAEEFIRIFGRTEAGCACEFLGLGQTCFHFPALPATHA